MSKLLTQLQNLSPKKEPFTFRTPPKRRRSSTKERNQLLLEWNKTQPNYAYEVCIHKLFEAQAKRTPDAIAVSFKGVKLTYRYLNRLANRLAHDLIDLGITPDMIVGLCVERSLDMIVGLLAILKAGAAYLLLDPSDSAARLAFMLADSQLSVLVTQEKWITRLPEHNAELVIVDWISENSAKNPLTNVKPDNFAYMIYTSDSRSRPKSVLIPHRGLSHLLPTQIEALDSKIQPKNRMRQFASFGFDFSISEMMKVLSFGNIPAN